MEWGWFQRNGVVKIWVSWGHDGVLLISLLQVVICFVGLKQPELVESRE